MQGLVLLLLAQGGSGGAGGSFWEGVTGGGLGGRRQEAASWDWARLADRGVAQIQLEPRPRRQSSNQRTGGERVLMTECPPEASCVRRNFCDSGGRITKHRDNRLKFAEDTRDLINCVHAATNSLGVCCRPRTRSQRPKIEFQRQLLEKQLEQLEQLEQQLEQQEQQEEEDVVPLPQPGSAVVTQEMGPQGPVVVININSDSLELAEGVLNSGRTDVGLRVVNKQPEEEDFGDVEDYDEYEDYEEDTEEDVGVINLSPDEIFTLMNMMGGRREANLPRQEAVFTTCPAATVCVDIDRCDFNGVIQTNPVQLTENQKSMRAALNKCAGNQGNRRQDSSGETYCCRDPNFSSPEKEDEDDDDFNINNFDFDDDGNVIMDINYDNYDMEMYPSPMYNPMEGPDESSFHNDQMEDMVERKPALALEKLKKSALAQKLQVPVKRRFKKTTTETTRFKRRPLYTPSKSIRVVY